jgi:benzoate-CoA ligase family protein
MLDTPAFAAAFLACMAIGAIPVPLNPKTSPDSLRYIMTDSRARFAVIEQDAIDTQAPTLRESPFIEKNGIFVQDHYHHTMPGNSGLNRLHIPDNNTVAPTTTYCVKKAQSVAFWQYSSGTTGLPKAITHTQVGMLESTEMFAKRTLGITSNDKIYSLPKMFFGYGLGNTFFFPLVLGAPSLIDSVWPTPKRVVENIKTYRPTVFFGAPAMYSAILDESLGIKDEDLSSIRLCFSAGSPLPEQLYIRWKERFGIPILDGIGATEAGHVFLSNTFETSRAGSTGYPVEGYEVLLVTEDGEEAKPGEQGVLMVKGPSLSSGYWENPALNQKKFKDGWYRTGDVFVRNKAGDYSCKGREDDLFKVNGRWVVPVEVESAVQRNFIKVKEAVLVGRENSQGLTEPVLFVCTDLDKSEENELSESILNYLSNAVESHKRPRDCIVLKELPRNDNGKLLRSQLSTSSRVNI